MKAKSNNYRGKVDISVSQNFITSKNTIYKLIKKTNIYNLEDFIKMTPLTSGLSKEQINELNKCDIEKITVDLKIIVGKVK